MKHNGQGKSAGSAAGAPTPPESTPPDSELKRLIVLSAVFLLAVIIWLIPPPTGVVAVGTPPLLAALALGFLSNLFSSLTHDGSGPAPVIFGSGYVELGTWWKLGALTGVINLLIWLIVGGVWWKIIGIW